MTQVAKRFAKLFAVLLTLLVLSAAGATDKPNIVFVFTDDFGWGDLGSYGGRFVPTPYMDRMAAEGVRFTQFYVASPICSPSRVGVTTGMFPARWRITSFLQSHKGNAACEQADYLDPAAPSVARLLKAGGTGVELYDLASDRYETNNLANRSPDAAKRLTDAALQWRDSLP